MLEDRMRTPAGILLGLTLFIASGVGGAVQAASAQRVALGEVSAVIPAGCTPVKGKMGTVEIIHCTWKAEGGETRSFRLSRDIRKNDRMLKLMGADIVGMSTVPEIIVAKHAGMKTLGFSVVTDMCLPDALEPADINKILAVAADGGAKLELLISELFRCWGSKS